MTPEKNMRFDKDAREAAAAGIEKLAKAVGVTLGPKGRNVMLDPVLGWPHVTKDGVTVARQVRLADKYEDAGCRLVKRAAEKQASDVGDGTTTVTVLAHALVKEGIKAVAAGMNPMDLKRGIDKAVDLVCQHIEVQSQPVANLDDIERVALISSNGDTEIAGVIRQAFDAVGKHGVITVEDSKSGKTGLEVIKGLSFDRGLMYPIFMTDPNQQVAELNDPLILIYDGKMNRLKDVQAILIQCVEEGRPILLMAESFDEDIIQTLALNKKESTMRVCPVLTPNFRGLKDDLLQDISILTGTPILTGSSDPGLNDRLTLADLGGASKVIVKRNSTIIIGGKGSAQELQSHCDAIAGDIENADGNHKRNLEMRLAGLQSGIAVVKIGGNTDVEIKERKDRVDDALHAVKAAASGGIVAGGGSALVHALEALEMAGANADQNMGIELVGRAIVEPARLIAANAGKVGEVIVAGIQQVKSEMDAQGEERVGTADSDINALAQFGSPFRWGYNAQDNVYSDLIRDGIIDPALVPINALKNAASIATLIITMEAVVSEERPDSDKRKVA